MLHNRFKKSLSRLAQCLALLFFALIMPSFLFASNASAETRSLKLFYIHTREKAEIVFKRDGRYDQAGLKKLNYFLRDWRRNEPTKMDPRLFDLIWTVYQLSGSRDYIHVVSAYRSPATNNMLRSRSKSSGVAKNSQHTLGHAMDFYIPDVKLATLRAVGLKQGVGGVGYYPTSGSPFVHMDTGSVRHWPRMSRRELMALFPDGKTMHIPTDGKPLQGYQQALAEYKSRGGQPATRVSGSKSEKKSGGGLFGLFGKKDKAPEPTPQPRTPSQNRPLQNDPVEPDPVQMAELPGSDAPVPSFSPVRDDEEDDDEAMVASFGNVPLPNYKPGEDNAVTPATEEVVATTQVAQVETQPEVQAQENVVVANVPVPVPMPGREQAVETVPDNTQVAEVVMPSSFPVPFEKPGAQQDVHVASVAPVQSANAATNAVNQQIVQASNEQNSSASSTNDVSVMAYANDQNAASNGNHGAEIQQVASVEPQNTVHSQPAVEIIPVPKDDDEEFDRNKKVRNKTQSPASNVINQMGGSSNQVASTNGSTKAVGSDLAINNELKEIPSVVFVSRLEKDKNTSPQYSALSGHAVDFHPITKVYK